ncbi:MAG: DUF1553 domain-containing protein [Verrucomicrobia bacterium]|nr:DUF1553 domain-containing protein [Verrucomicrobiota bacterium]
MKHLITYPLGRSHITPPSYHTWLLAITSLLLACGQSQAEPISFARQIRPLLSDACFQCHGPDAQERKADLRLDQEHTAKSRDGDYWVIKESDPDGSDLVARIFASDSDDVMPPPDSGKSLNDDEKKLIREWIKQGAPWETHWSFEPARRPDIPTVKDTDWPNNAIDFFILSKLEANGMRPSKEADPQTLMRRLHLDVTGLPPGVDTVRQFAESENPLDYQQTVDSLIADEGFGERLSVHWLDLVRYADTVGYHGDQPYSVWPYRDYVINAFNGNMPFDQFTLEQIAGDLVPNPTRSQKVASGFNRLHMITAEGGAQDKEYLAKYAADRVRATSGVWLGATMGCAECHDHKFDPYTMKDFYSMAAFFGDLKEKGFYGGSGWGPKMPLPSPQQENEQKQLKETVESLEKVLVTSTEELVNAQLDWEKQLMDLELAGQLSWHPLSAKTIHSVNGTEFIQQSNGAILTRGPKPDKENFEIEIPIKANRRITGIRLEALTHPSMDENSLSRGGGNFVLSEFELVIKNEDGETPVKLESAQADFAQRSFEASKAIDGKDETGWAVDGKNKKETRQLLITLQEPLLFDRDATLVARLEHQSKHEKNVIGRFRLSTTSVPNPVLSETGIPDDVYRLVSVPWEERSTQETAELADYFYGRSPILEPARLQLAAAKSRIQKLEKDIPTMLVSLSVEPRPMRILPRGNWMDDSGPVVNPAIPGFMDYDKLNSSQERLSRLDLANWLVSEQNPLTARNFVNHLWKLYFGYGLARVMEDSGSQGTPPTHPELMDWLASEFVRSGWDIKHMVRLIVNSQTYRQTSTPSKTLATMDPYNQLFARQTRYRLDAEMIRDQALDISGLLVRQIGGPSVRPYQPSGYYSQLNFPKRTYKHDKGNSQYRRGLYTHWQRTFLHPMLKAFDAPTREECTAQRPRSNTPLQSLNLLNDPSFVEAARTFAAGILSSPAKADHQRIRSAFESVVLRQPTHRELMILEQLLIETREGYSGEPERGLELVKVGLNQAGKQCPPAELGAWTAVTRALFNLHETITRY